MKLIVRRDIGLQVTLVEMWKRTKVVIFPALHESCLFLILTTRILFLGEKVNVDYYTIYWIYVQIFVAWDLLMNCQFVSFLVVMLLCRKLNHLSPVLSMGQPMLRTYDGERSRKIHFLLFQMLVNYIVEVLMALLKMWWTMLMLVCIFYLPYLWYADIFTC